jgi:hypothetical protein
VRRIKTDTNLQNTKREIGECENPLNNEFLEKKENRKRESTASNRPITPPSLLGIERRMA